MPDTAQKFSARRMVFAALMRKEWQEQRWRFFLGTLVLGGLLAGLLRAQVVDPMAAALLIYWPAGLGMVIFLAMAPVATEHANRTWEFLIAQPLSRADVLLSKWAVGLLQLGSMLAIITLAGLLALWSRGFYHTSLSWNHPAVWLCTCAAMTAVALGCWYTPLFLILTRARNEFAAALGGVLLTIALHAWLAQSAHHEWPFKFLNWIALLNPLSPLAIHFQVQWKGWKEWGPLIAAIVVLLWMVFPVWYVRRTSRKALAL